MRGKSFFPAAVCLFDSGVGGLSVLFKCREILPSRKFIYYGDNVRAPYGNLPPEAICGYVSEAAEELAGYFPPALVLACNTAEACCGESLRKKYPFPVLGACPPVLAAGKNGGDGLVLVTRATYESRAFASLLRQAEMRFPPPFLSVSVRFACRKNRRYACFGAGRILHGGIACAKIFFRCIRLHALRARARGDRPPVTAAPCTTARKGLRAALP